MTQQQTDEIFWYFRKKNLHQNMTMLVRPFKKAFLNIAHSVKVHLALHGLMRKNPIFCL